MNFFNNNTSQLAIVAFLDWFSKLSIEKFQTVSLSGDDYFIQRKIIPVPICWGTREKMVEILRSSSARKAMNPELRDKNPVEMQWILPRISANLNGMTYDPARRLIKTQQIDDKRNSSKSKDSVYSPTPYNLDLEITTISRNIDENFQIMEQILPYFSPTMNMTLKLQPDSEPESIAITLNSVSIDNPTDIPENEERIFTNTYTFTMKLNYFIPKRNSNIIDHIGINIEVGSDLIRIDKTYIELINRIQDKFTQYSNNSSMANPVVHITTSIPSTYSKPVEVS